MPVARVSIQTPPEGIAAKIVELEAANNKVGHISKVGDEYFIIYEPKPKVGRPPKMETR